MNVALVTVAQGIIAEHDRYLEINQNESLLTGTEEAHNTTMVRVLNRLKTALASHVEETGIISDELLAKIIIETHGEIASEMINWTQDVELDKRMAARKSA